MKASSNQLLLVPSNILSAMIANRAPGVSKSVPELITESIEIAKQLADNIIDEEKEAKLGKDFVLHSVIGAFKTLGDSVAPTTLLTTMIMEDMRVPKDMAIAILQKAVMLGIVNKKSGKGKLFKLSLNPEYV